MGEMHDQSDAQLLRAYAERGAEAAFAEIVARHTDLVYSAALRQVYSPDLARDVTQSVFTDLARKAREVSWKLTPEASLIGWLYRGTRFAARDLYRNETRRTQRERQAMEQLHPTSETPPDWEQLRPVLDDAMSELEDSDREAVLLRYFKNHDLRTVGATLAISDDAAQKRVSRAVERLREFFAKRGVTIGASGLAVVISANAVQAAPVGLALTISTAAALTGTTLATTATVTTTKAIAMTALQKTIVTATIAVLAGAGIYEARQAAQLRDQNQTLQQRQSPMAEQITQLQAEREKDAERLSALRDDNERLNRNTAELLRLRGEAARNRASIHDQATDPTTTAAKSWLERVNKLKQRLEQDQRQAIPELRFVSEDDWLSAAKNRLETEGDFRQALGSIRSIASAKAAGKFLDGLKRYLSKNNGQFPSDISELASYLPQSMDASILSRWEIRPASEVKNHNLKGEWLIVEKTAVDEAYDWQWLVSSDQSNCIKFGELGQIDKAGIALIIEPVRQAFAAANGGRDPKNPAEALAYATTTEQQEAMQTLIRLYQQHTQTPTNQTPQQ